MGLIHEDKIYGLTLRESAEDGSDFTNPDADYRRVFLGEDGVLYGKNSAGTVSSLSSGLPASKDWFTDNADRTDYPGSPNSLDDEFEGGGSLDVKWTLVNDPGITQATYGGFAYCLMAENTGTDNFDALIRMYQAPPVGTATMDFIAKVAMVANGHIGGEGSEFASVGVYLGNPTNDEMQAAAIQFNWTTGQYEQFLSQQAIGQKSTAGTLGNMGSVEATRGIVPGQHVFLKLSKLGSAAYTSSNVYAAYVSGDGILWQIVGFDTFTFTTLPTEVGLYFRRPKSQAGTPTAEGIVDFFRKSA